MKATRIVLVFGMLVGAVLLLPAIPASAQLPVTGGLKLWLDGDDLDADGVSEGLSESGQSGGVVTTWLDKSSTGMTATQTNATYQPQLSLAGLGGNDVVAFTNNDWLPVVANSPTGYQTTFVVYQDTSTKSWTTPIGANIAGNGGVFHGASNDAGLFDGGWTHANTRNGDNYRNGTDIGDGTSTPRPDVYAIDLHVGAAAFGDAIQSIAADDCCNPGRGIEGGIAEIIMYDRNLSFPERNQVGNYLEGKWGITWTDVVEPPPPPEGLEAIAHRWSFNDTGDGHNGMSDSIGTAHGAAENGNVFVAGEELNITAAGRMLTSAIGASIGEKTLVVWTTLDDPAFRSAGSALTIENDAGGGVFDAIVYAERTDRQWMAGSNSFQRTPVNNGGAAETSTDEVMMAIVYAADNSITLYRNGVPYGNSYVQGTLVPYNSNAVVQIGRRHGTHANTYIGSINEGRIYADALSADDIQLLYQLVPQIAIEGTPRGDFA